MIEMQKNSRYLRCRDLNNVPLSNRYADGLVKDFSISSALAMEKLQSCSKLSTHIILIFKELSVHMECVVCKQHLLMAVIELSRVMYTTVTLHEHHSISNHKQPEWLCNSMFRIITKVSSKCHIISLLWGESTRNTVDFTCSSFRTQLFRSYRYIINIGRMQ